VSSDTLENFEIPITEKKSDKLKTVIEAKRFDGTPISIEVIRIDENLTEISIRTGRFGIWDKRVSGQIHNSIEKNLVQFSHKDKDLVVTEPENNYQAPPKESSDQEIPEIPPEKQTLTRQALTKSNTDSSIQSNTEPKINDTESHFKDKMVVYSPKDKDRIETKPEDNYQAPPKASSDQEASEIPPEKQISTNVALTEASEGSSSQSNTEPKIYDVKSQVGSKFKIFFQENSNEISETAAKTLDQIFEIMIDNPDSELIIIGFPDSEDPPPYNKMVSELRVAGVKMYLIGKGLNPSKAKTNLLEEGKMQPNHSVEIKINTQPSE
jgi:outer membrane protein OmpA-like peptidoglycan-associated protein